MRLGLLLITAATTAGLSAASVGACLGTSSVPPSGSAPPAQTSPSAENAPRGASSLAEARPAPGAPLATVDTTTDQAVRDAGSPLDASAQHVSAQCDSPTVAVTGPPRSGVVFNNAMTSADAGSVDRTALVLEALDSQTQRIRCCLQPWGEADGPAQGTLRLVVELDQEGKAGRAEVDPMRSSPLPAGVADCITAVVRATTFPRSPASRPTVVDYPLNLSRSGG